MNIKLILLIIIIIVIYYFNNNYEHFYDLTPYQINWDINKCLTGDCVIKKSYGCYKYCGFIDNDRDRHMCEIDCLDTGDEMMDNLKWQNYNWPLDDSNKYFKRYTILNNTNDYVNV